MSYNQIDAHYLLGLPSDHADGLIAVVDQVEEAFDLPKGDDNKILGIISSICFSQSRLKEDLHKCQEMKKIHVLRQMTGEIDSVWENGIKIAGSMGFNIEVEVPEMKHYKIAQIAEANPEIKMILTLTNLQRKTVDLKELSQLDNVAIKILLSTLDREEAKASVLDLIDLFSTEKTMFGRLSKEKVSLLESIVSDFSEGEKENLFSTSAAKWYHLAA